MSFPMPPSVSRSPSLEGSLPLVSCILAVGDSTRFLQAAIRDFQRQQYPNRELLIVGESPVCSGNVEDAQVRWVDAPCGETEREKIVRGANAARGSVIAHWSDDWNGPERLTQQVAALDTHNAQLTGLTQLSYIDPLYREAWDYAYGGRQPWLAHPTWAYYRAVADLEMARSNAPGFVRRLDPDNVHDAGAASWFVARMPTTPDREKRLRSGWWRKGRLHTAPDHIQSARTDSRFSVSTWRGEASKVDPATGDPATGNSLTGHSATGHSPTNDFAKNGAFEPNSSASPTARETACALANASESKPLVSCLMPTGNRERFARQAVRYFQRQTYPSRELVIVDDGDTDDDGTVDDDDRSGDHAMSGLPHWADLEREGCEPAPVQYLRVPAGTSIGAKRNAAVQAARGELLLCWDDDDWYGPERIERQIEPILAGRAGVTALGQSLFYHVESDEFWTCSAEIHARMFYQHVIGGTLAFCRSDWRASGGFPAQSMAEDASFLRRLLRRNVVLERVSSENLFIYVRHGANSWQFATGKHLGQSGWSKASPPSALSSTDHAFYTHILAL